MVSYYYMVFAVFLPLSYVERHRQYIQVDLFAQMTPAKAQLAPYLLADLVDLALFGALTHQSFLDNVAAAAQQQTTMSNLGLPGG